MSKPVALIGYSGHAFVAAEILLAMGKQLKGYFEQSEKKINPYQLAYLGNEKDNSESLKQMDYFIAIGDNNTRKHIHQRLLSSYGNPLSIVHPSACISVLAKISTGVMISARVCINPLAQIGQGVICNTGCIIEHDCFVGDFAHIAPGAILGGNVRIGERSLVGAGAVIKPGIHIGAEVVVGAGAVIVKSVPDGQTVIGNPQKTLAK